MRRDTVEVSWRPYYSRSTCDSSPPDGDSFSSPVYLTREGRWLLRLSYGCSNVSPLLGNPGRRNACKAAAALASSVPAAKSAPVGGGGAVAINWRKRPLGGGMCVCGWPPAPTPSPHPHPHPNARPPQPRHQQACATCLDGASPRSSLRTSSGMPGSLWRLARTRVRPGSIAGGDTVRAVRPQPRPPTPPGPATAPKRLRHLP